MSDTETIVDDVTTTVDTDIDTTDDVPDEKSKLLSKYGIEPDFSNFDEDTALKFLKRIEKAEWLTVQQKKQLKELQSKSSEPAVKYLTEADLERRDFLKANPELNEYTKELEDYQSKGLSLDEIKTLILNSDKAHKNREKLNSLGLSDWETNKWKTYTDEDLVALSKKDINAYNKAMNDIESGKAKHK